MKRYAILVLVAGLIMAMALNAMAEGEGIVLKKGSRGNEVNALQARLSELGYYSHSIDQRFGPSTERALRTFQRRNGLEETGVATQEVLDVLYSDYAEGISDEYIRRNLLHRTAMPELGETNYSEGIWRVSGGGTGTVEIVGIIDAPVKGIRNGFHVVSTEDNGKVTDAAINAVPLKYGEIYVLSCYAKGYGKLHIMHGKDPWSDRAFPVTDEWQHYSLAFKVGDGDGSTAEDPSNNVYFGAYRYANSNILICGMKLEKASGSDWTKAIGE